jgi:hypothetical protein
MRSRQNPKRGAIPTVLGEIPFDENGDNLLPGRRMDRFTNGGYFSYPGE